VEGEWQKPLLHFSLCPVIALTASLVKSTPCEHHALPGPNHPLALLPSLIFPSSLPPARPPSLPFPSHVHIHRYGTVLVQGKKSHTVGNFPPYAWEGAECLLEEREERRGERREGRGNGEGKQTGKRKKREERGVKRVAGMEGGGRECERKCAEGMDKEVGGRERGMKEGEKQGEGREGRRECAEGMDKEEGGRERKRQEGERHLCFLARFLPEGHQPLPSTKVQKLRCR